MRSHISYSLKVKAAAAAIVFALLVPSAAILAQSVNISPQSNTNNIPSQATSPGSGQSGSAGGTNTGNSAGGTNNVAPSTFTLQNPLKANSVSEIILAFMQIASYIAVLFGVLALVYVGLQFILARGNSERMKELSRWLMYIVIGIAVILGARIIVSVIIGTLQATGTVNPAIIQSAQNARSGL